MASSPQRSHNHSCKPTLSFYKVFSLVWGSSSLVSTASVKYYGKGLKLFALFQLMALGVGVATYSGTFLLIRLLKKRGLVGTNLNDVDSAEKVPEPGALLGCLLYLMSMIFVQLIHGERCGKVFLDPQSSKAVRLNPALLSMVLMTLLGLIDDILRLNWSSKILGPMIASIPLCLAYNITRPKLAGYLPWKEIHEHYGAIASCAFIVLLTVFCANSINIYSGINGLEVGQSLVMAVFIVLFCSLEMYMSFRRRDGIELVLEKKICTFYLTLPFIAVNAALLCFNWYPARLFVGNVYTLFSGAFFAVISIIGDLWEITPFLFLPQLLNFCLSIPQLTGIVPCPRHRVPRFNAKTRRLENSGNLTLINLFLSVTFQAPKCVQVAGPMAEERLTLTLIVLQTFCGLLGLISKYYVL